MAGNLDWKLRLPCIHFRVLLHATCMRHGTNGFTYLPKEGVLRIFFALKNPTASARFELENLGTKVQHAKFKCLEGRLILLLCRQTKRSIWIKNRLYGFIRFLFVICYVVGELMLVSIEFNGLLIWLLRNWYISFSKSLQLPPELMPYTHREDGRSTCVRNLRADLLS